MDFRKLKDLLKGSPNYQPNMGDVKQADRATGLGVKPQLVRGYGEDQDTMDSLRELARKKAEIGLASNEPTDKDLENEKMIQDMAMGSMGSIKRIDPAIDFVRGLTNIGPGLKVPNVNSAQAMLLREQLAKQGRVAKDATISMGDVTAKVKAKNEPVTFKQSEVDDLIAQFPALRKVFYPIK
jgi:hypothetical protein